MHFRYRANVVQVVRTTYDAEQKRAKAEVLGTISKASPEVSERLQSACSADELREVQQWIGTRLKNDSLRAELAARELAESVSKAADWLSSLDDKEFARFVTSQALYSFQMFRQRVRKAGLLD